MKNLLFIAALFVGSAFASAQSKIAHMNSEEAIEAIMPNQQRLVDWQEEENNLIAISNDINATSDKLESELEELSLEENEIRLVRLQKRMDSYLEREKEFSDKILEYDREVYEVKIAMQNAISVVCNRHGYDYVLDVSVLLMFKGPDITQEVIAEMRKGN